MMQRVDHSMPLESRPSRRQDPCPIPTRSSSPTKRCHRSGHDGNVSSHASTGIHTKSILSRSSYIDEPHQSGSTANKNASVSSRRICDEPEAWFQHVLRMKKMSPLDLCDRFCFGDAQRHRVVPLRHVCDVMFALAMTTENMPAEKQACEDPLTEEMEEFLYRFSYDPGDGEIVVDIKEALRSLDIWPTARNRLHASAPSLSINPSIPRAVSPARMEMLQVKAERLKSVIATLQDENTRLSRSLGDTTTPTDRSLLSSSPRHIVSNRLSSPQDRVARSFDRSALLVDDPEQELAVIAEKLQYEGVKALEERLYKVATGTTMNDGSMAGENVFVSFKHVRWLLVHEFEVDISETHLMELCMGMTFNAQGQLDYRSLIQTLMDMLLYEGASFSQATPGSSPDKCTRVLPCPPLGDGQLAIIRLIREYLSGFRGSRDTHRRVLELMCDKYDLEQSQWLSLVEMARVLHHDLVQEHPHKARLTLSSTDLMNVLQHIARNGTRHRDGMVFYPDVVNILFTPDGSTAKGDAQQRIMVPRWQARAFTAAFWIELRRALCPNRASHSEQQVHHQLSTIFSKLDPRRSFVVSAKQLRRVLDQHWVQEDMDVLIEVLATRKRPDVAALKRRDGDGSWVRYDVLMRLVFGAPELQDEGILAALATKLHSTEGDGTWCDRVVNQIEELAHDRGEDSGESAVGPTRWLSMENVQGFLSPALTPLEVLYAIGWLVEPPRHPHEVRRSRLSAFLLSLHSTSDRSRNLSHPRAGSPSVLQPQATPRATRFAILNTKTPTFEPLRRQLRELCHEHDLETSLNRLARHEQGVVRVDHLAEVLATQLAKLCAANDSNPLANEAHVLCFLRHLHEVNGVEHASQVRIAALMDAIFDWRRVVRALRLPQRLVDVKRTLELFDWDRDGRIHVEDWHKVWCQVTTAQEPLLEDWEVRVLLRRFTPPLDSSDRSAVDIVSRAERARSAAFDYSRMLVFLLEYQQQDLRTRLQERVITTFRRKCAEVLKGKSNMTTLHLDKLFAMVDRDGKGFFTSEDLHEFLRREIKNTASMDHGKEDGDPEPDQELNAMLSNSSVFDALDSVVEALAGVSTAQEHTGRSSRVDIHHSDRGSSSNAVSSANNVATNTVSLMRFQELVTYVFQPAQVTPIATTKPTQHKLELASSRHDNNKKDKGHNGSLQRSGYDVDSEKEFTTDQLPPNTQPTQVNLLRDLELCILEISQQFADAKGHILPTAAYAHLSGHQRLRDIPSRRPRSQSPVRISEPLSSKNASRRASVAAPRSISTSSLDPLSVQQLQQTLGNSYGIQTSTHLIGQFFLHVGASNKYFLELVRFAQWVSPLSIDMQHRNKELVKMMLVKSKSAAGQVNLDRFLTTLQRRLQDQVVWDTPNSPARVDSSASPFRAEVRCSGIYRGDGDDVLTCVRAPVLLACLHRMNIPLHNSELSHLRRHFGMEADEMIEFRVLITRMYELCVVAQ